MPLMDGINGWHSWTASMDGINGQHPLMANDVINDDINSLSAESVLAGEKLVATYSIST
jgi:hypothetical protein